MLTFKEKKEIGLSANQIYDCLLDFLTNNPFMKEKKVEIKRSEPFYIDISITPPLLWVSGNIKINILSKNGKSEIEFIFDFRRFYFAWWLVLALLTAIFLIPTHFLVLGGIWVFFLVGPAWGMGEKKEFMDNINSFFAGLISK